MIIDPGFLASIDEQGENYMSSGNIAVKESFTDNHSHIHNCIRTAETAPLRFSSGNRIRLVFQIYMNQKHIVKTDLPKSTVSPP